LETVLNEFDFVGPNRKVINAKRAVGSGLRGNLKVGGHSVDLHLRASDHGATGIGHRAVYRAQRLLSKHRMARGQKKKYG
jgi:hypothetical protein